MSHPPLRATSAEWNPADYAANSAAQHAWARELMVRLALRGDEQVLDVGCGDGKVTAEIARVLKNGGISGIDSSRQMIEFACKTFPQTKQPNLDFQVMDARCIELEQRFDIVFSSSVLHWVDDPPARAMWSWVHGGAWGCSSAS